MRGRAPEDGFKFLGIARRKGLDSIRRKDQPASKGDAHEEDRQRGENMTKPDAANHDVQPYPIMDVGCGLIRSQNVRSKKRAERTGNRDARGDAPSRAPAVMPLGGTGYSTSNRLAVMMVTGSAGTSS